MEKMKRRLVIGLVVLLVVGVTAALAFAETNSNATSQATAGGAATTGTVAKRPQPTEQQKAELKELQIQMLNVREKMIDKYAEYGWITSDQAKYAKDQIELQKKYAGTNVGGGLGMGLGHMGRRGRGAQGNGGPNGMMGPGGMMNW